MGLHYGTSIRSHKTLVDAEAAAIARHSHYYTDAAGRSISCAGSCSARSTSASWLSA